MASRLDSRQPCRAVEHKVERLPSAVLLVWVLRLVSQQEHGHLRPPLPYCSVSQLAELALAGWNASGGRAVLILRRHQLT